MLNFIICEDNKESLNKVNTLLTRVLMPYNFDYKIHKFSQYNKELQDIINDTNTQKIYILDVELPEVSGLEIASEIREKDWNSVIIFLTAHNECKDDVFYSRLLAIDYIAKNVLSYSRLAETIKLVLDRFNQEKIFIFRYDSITYRIPHNNILYIEKVQSNKKCLIITEDGETYEVCETISNLLKILGKDFYQSHKSCIVNVTKIKHIDFTENFITFKNGKQTELLSNRHRKDLREYVSNY
jgi:two-component system response regulator AgrA